MSTELAAGPQTVVLREAAEGWVRGVAHLLETRDPNLVDALFLEQCSWRDLLALKWDLRSAVGKDAVRELVCVHGARHSVRDLRIAEGTEPNPVDAGPAGSWLEVPLAFETAVGTGHGLARLVPVDEEWMGISLVTALDTVGETPRRRVAWTDRNNPEWTTSQRGRPNWVDRRDPHRPFPTDSPTVLVVGAGQCGTALAARFDRAGLDAVVIERSARLGDSWRQRHHNLITHTPSFTDHLPYLHFPDNWPIAAPKDRLANWIESYADALGLDVWTSTEMTEAEYDDAAGHWRVEIRRASGTRETLHPEHLVLATGLLSIPSVPELPGRDEFHGTVMHSSEYRRGDRYRGLRVLVIGSGASGHDIAQDLWEHGVEDVTMVQRSETYVMSFEHGVHAAYGAFYSHESTRDLDAADLAFSSFPLPVAIAASRAATPQIAELDRELLAGLRSIGFRLNHDGMLANGLSSGVGGYYIDQGCSQLLVDGHIGLKRGELVGFDRSGALFADGSRCDVDLVVLCTGYRNMRESARVLLGEDVWRRCKEMWVLDSDRGGEHSGLWTDSGHPHLWFMAGSLHYARVYSKYLALRIKAEAAGLVPEGGR